MRRLLGVALFFLALAQAQVGTGTLTGRITDATTAAVPGVQIKVVNEESGSTAAVLTNHEGIYRASSLLPGSYRIEARATGFDPVVRKNVVLEVAQTLAADFTLAVGQQNQTIEVTGDLASIDTQTSSLGQLVNRRMIDDLPLPNRRMIDDLPLPNRAATSLVN